MLNTLNTKIIALNLIFLPILLGLSNWQWQKARSVKQQLQLQQQYQNNDPLKGWQQQWHNYQRVTLQGQLDLSQSVLLDNQIWYGEVGYQLLTPLYIDNQLLLVNRGWVPKTITPIQMGTNKLNATVTGTIYQTRLPNTTTALTLEPIPITQDLNMTKLSQVFNQKPTTNYILYLDVDSPFAKRMQYPFQKLSVHKHINYAIQWLLFAVVLIISSIIICYRHASK